MSFINRILNSLKTDSANDSDSLERQSTSTPDQAKKYSRILVVGLGNPGAKYDGTRHNIGFEVLDNLIDDWSEDKKRKGLRAKKFIDGVEVHFLKPQTFMNLSGVSVQAYCAYYDISPRAVIIVHDEVDISFGDIRTKCGGGSAGHNGIKSIESQLGTKDFWRVRVGVGRPTDNMPLDAFVLARWTNEQKTALNTLIEHATHTVDNMLVNVQR